MCTICGHFSMGSEIPSNDIYDMLAKMKHRGPDTHGVYLDGRIERVEVIDQLKGKLGKSKVAMGHSRLSIIGRGSGSQPFVSCDGKLTLIHNGEIYNYQELKTLLLRKHQIRTESDSEILIHLLEESYQGDLPDAVKKLSFLLDGMYTLAVTDGKSIVVARDPVGKKPLYLIKNENVIYFASERKALWNGKDEPIRLMPGKLIELSDKGADVQDGIQLQLPQISIVDFREAVDEYKKVLKKAMEKRLTGLQETRLGVIFSGGVDSVLVANLLQSAGKNVICYCTGTKDSGDIIAAKKVAQELGLELKVTLIDEEMVSDILPEIIRSVEESGLLQVEVAVPMYLAAKTAALDDIRVMYTGQAADELFAGYPWYNEELANYGYVRLHEKLWEDLNYLYTDTLEREDKMTMAHSIELRAPFLDRDVIHTAMQISPRLKIEGSDDALRKRVHRQAAVELGVPPSLAFRAKDPAQSGSGIHGIIERIARGHKADFDPELAAANVRRDKASFYRYGIDDYGKELTRSYLQQIEEEIKARYIPPFLQPSSECKPVSP